MVSIKLEMERTPISQFGWLSGDSNNKLPLADRPFHASLDRPINPHRKTKETIQNHDGNTSSGSFPLKLHRMLNTAHEDGLESIVSWLPGGNGFKVHKIQQFVATVLPRFFTKQTKYKSFQRQLVSLYRRRLQKEGS